GRRRLLYSDLQAGRHPAGQAGPAHGHRPAEATSRPVEAAVQLPVLEKGGAMDMKVVKSDEEWRSQLTEEQYRVTRRHGTERAFTGPWLDNKAPGTYRCVCCGKPLFDAAAKYESGSGWPSFWQPLDADA